MNFLDIALEYNAAGLNVVPCWKKPDGKVSFPSWTKWQSERQTAEDVKSLFEKECHAIAMICTDGIEAIDIDVKHDPKKTIAQDFFDYVKLYMNGPENLKKCVLQKTKSGGWHLIYKTDTLEGNTKLTVLEGCNEAVIETRGKGGLLFVAPSPGYEIKQGSLSNIQHIDDKGRARLWRCARELSTVDDIVQDYVDYTEPEDSAPSPAPVHEVTADNLSGEKPWDAYNRKNPIQAVAEKYGWTYVSKQGGIVRLSRPGSKSGDIHASIVKSRSGQEVLYVFTTATDLKPEFCYDAFALYAKEEHGGDRRAAARAAYAAGYGDRLAKPTLPPQVQQPGEVAPKDMGSLIDTALSTQFDFNAPLPNEKCILHLEAHGKRYKLAGFGQIGIFTGGEKSGKTFVLSCLLSSSMGGNTLGFSLDLEGKEILYIDSEQSTYFFARTQRRVHELAGLHQNAKGYKAFNLRRFSPVERLEIIQAMIDKYSNVGVLVLDGIVDLLCDYNNLAESQALVSRLMSWSFDRNILILGVLHVNKGDGKIRGHIGSELKNKADFMISVSRNENRYMVSNPNCRYGEFKSFEFDRDLDTGLPIWDGMSKQAASTQFPLPAPTPEPNLSAYRPGTDQDIPF